MKYIFSFQKGSSAPPRRSDGVLSGRRRVPFREADTSASRSFPRPRLRKPLPPCEAPCCSSALWLPSAFLQFRYVFKFLSARGTEASSMPFRLASRAVLAFWDESHGVLRQLQTAGQGYTDSSATFRPNRFTVIGHKHDSLELEVTVGVLWYRFCPELHSPLEHSKHVAVGILLQCRMTSTSRPYR